MDLNALKKIDKQKFLLYFNRSYNYLGRHISTVLIVIFLVLFAYLIFFTYKYYYKVVYLNKTNQEAVLQTVPIKFNKSTYENVQKSLQERAQKREKSKELSLPDPF